MSQEARARSRFKLRESLRNHLDTQAIDAQHAPGYTTEYAPGAARPLNEEQNRMVLQGFWMAFPDLRLEIRLQVANDQYVVSHWFATGTHTGPLHTVTGGRIEPTGKKVKLAGSTTMETQDGKHKRSWMFYDQASLLAQLGPLPSP